MVGQEVSAAHGGARALDSRAMMLQELLAHPEVTEVCELRGRFGLMAFHGGNLERTTDAVAHAVAKRTASSFYGVLQEPPLRRHLASTRFDPAHSEALASFLGHVDVVIAVHGYGRKSLWHHLLVGGGNRSLARHVAGHLRDELPEPYEVLDDLDEIPKELRGQHARNPVNRVRERGVQLELPPSIRWNRAENGWSDHLGISRTAHVDQLIDALSAAVSSWG
jgi:phage replication-related protein YjqB (UPF0714/DUF867 family)